MPARMDHIFIRDFRLQTLIGFHRRERVVPQTIRIDLEIGIRDDAVFASDRVADCIDYDKVTARIREVASEHVNLVETLADRVARLVLEEFGASWVKVSIAKLGILKDVALVGVSVERGQRTSRRAPPRLGFQRRHEIFTSRPRRPPLM